MRARHHSVSAGTAAVVTLCLLGCRRGQEPPAVTKAPPARPNVILISIDTLRADRLNSYGYTARQVSPNMDALARDGILFENHISSAPWTTPAHLSLLTSLSPSAHGMMQTFSELRDRLERGEPVNGLPEERTTMAERLRGQAYATAAFTGGVTLDPRLGFAQGFDEYDTSMFKLQPGNVGRLLAWVRAHRDAPFFLFWHTFEVHAPYLHATFVGEVLPRPLASAVRRSTRPFSRLDPTHEIPPRDLAGDLASLGAMRREVCEALYVGGIHAMDGWIGELVRVLRESAMYDRTLIVLTSDHGEEFADHSPDQIYNKHGRTLYEELLRVPLVVKLADRRAAGTRVREVSRAIDMLPTVLQAVGLPGSADMEGRPLQPLWEDPPEGRVPRVAFAEGTILRREEGGPDGPLQVHRLDRAGGGRALRAVPPAGDAGASRAVRPAGGSG